MGDLDGFGKLSIKTINSKRLAFEATAGGSGNADKIKITSNKDLANNYNLILPAVVPPDKGTLQTTSDTLETFLWADKSTEFELGSTLSAEGAANNYKIRVLSNGAIYYGVESVWRRINNWFSVTDLADFVTTDIQNITHDTTVDRFFVSSVVPNSGAGGWYRIETENYATPSPAVNIDSDAVPGHGASNAFAFQTILPYHDSFTSNGLQPNMGVIILNKYEAATKPYVEWMYTGSTVLSGKITARFGFIQKLAPAEAIAGTSIDTNATSWGKKKEMTINNGVTANIDQAITNCSWYSNDVFLGTEPIVTPHTTWRVKAGDRIQFYIDSVVGSAEVVYVSHNTRMGISTQTGLTFTDIADKGYYMSTDNTERWRVSRNPLQYLGTLTPTTYILNCDI